MCIRDRAMPLCKAGLATVGLFIALNYWNDWYDAMLFLDEEMCIRDRRMRRAEDLIRSTDYPIYQIAQEVGYEGVSQFSAVFKRQYGVTPCLLYTSRCV